jgi:hypothetical protein
MKRLAFVTVAVLAGLAACSQGASNATNAAPSVAPAAPATYQMDIIPGSAQWSVVVVRINGATGQATLSNAGQAFIHVAEPTPPPAGVYHLSHFTTLDSGATTREWEMYRIEAGSGRVWYLNYDGQSAASWVELTGAP